MLYEYVLTYKDYVASQKLHYKRRLMGRISYFFWVWFLPALGICATIPYLVGIIQSRDQHYMASHVSFLVAGAWFAVFIPLFRWFNLRRCWNATLPKDVRNNPITLEFTSDQIISTIPGRSEGRFFFHAVQTFAQDANITLLYVQKKRFLFVPTSALPPEEWQLLRGRLPSNATKA